MLIPDAGTAHCPPGGKKRWRHPYRIALIPDRELYPEQPGSRLWIAQGEPLDSHLEDYPGDEVRRYVKVDKRHPFGEDTIWLAPFCDECDRLDAWREWCEDNVWGECEEFDCKAAAICYTRED